MLRDVGSKKEVFHQFDRHVGTRTVFASDHGGAAVLWLRSSDTNHSPYLGLAISSGCNERRVQNSPLVGSAEAVRDCAREIIAAGGRPVAVTDCLNFGNAEDPVVMRQLSDSVDGISAACQELSTPVVSGNVSLYNATGNKSIYPTPMIGMVGIVDDVRRVTPATVQNAVELSVYELSARSDMEPSFAASLVAKVSHISPDDGRISDIHWPSEKIAYRALDMIRSNCELLSARAVAEGGLGVAIFKMLSRLICSGFDLEILPNRPKEFFAEGGSRFLVSLTNPITESLKSDLNQMGVDLELVAKVQRKKVLVHGSGRPKLFGGLKTYFGEFPLEGLWRSYNSFIGGEGG